MSICYRFCADCRKRSAVALLTTPGIDELEWDPESYVSGIANLVLGYVNLQATKCRKERIDLFGYSRGAVAAAYVAQNLNRTDVPVNFLGLADPVITGTPINAAWLPLVMPSNVQASALIVATRPMDGALSLVFRPAPIQGEIDAIYYFAGNHVNVSEDRAGRAERFLLNEARAAGAPI